MDNKQSLYSDMEIKPDTLRSPSDLLKEAIEIFKERVGVFITMGLLSMIPSILLPVMESLFDKLTPGIISSIFVLLLDRFIIFLYFAALLCLISKRSMGVKDSFQKALYKILPLFLTGVLTFIITTLGYVFLIVPGIIFSIQFQFVPFVVIIDRLKGRAALSKSKDLVGDKWPQIIWRSFFILLVLMSTYFILGLFGIKIISKIVNALVPQIVIIYYFLLYENLKEQHSEVKKDSVSVESQIEDSIPNKKTFPLSLILFIILALVMGFLIKTGIINRLAEKYIPFSEQNIEPEDEIAFIKDGDIWLLSKDLKNKDKILDTEEAIIDFSFSPDGKIIYWLNERGEIFKKDEQNGIKSLVTVEKNMKEEIEEGWEDFESFSYLKGKVTNFYLSPDGKYIAYKTVEMYTGCCAGPPNMPVLWIRIMKNDGTEKVEIEKPPDQRRLDMSFDNWFPNSKKIIFHFRSFQEVIQGSPFFEIGVNGKNPKLYTAIYQEDYPELGDTITVARANPIFSPSGDKMAYIKGGLSYTGDLWLANSDGTEKMIILEKDKTDFTANINWSEDGNLLSVVEYPGSIIVLNQKGEVILKTKVGEESITVGVFSLDNKYLSGTYEKEGSEIIFLVDLITEEKKEFKLPSIETKYGLTITPKFFSKNSRLYYFVDPIDSEEEKFLPQLWVIDTNTWRNYKIVDGVSRIEKYIPFSEQNTEVPNIEVPEENKKELQGTECEKWLKECAKEEEGQCGPCGCRSCCSGLVSRDVTHPYRNENNKVVCLENMTAYICVKCGDGICSKKEDWCICPEDCQKPDLEDLEF